MAAQNPQAVRGYRSVTEYRFRDEQADAIARTTAYNRRDFGLSVIWFPPREHADILPSMTKPFARVKEVPIFVSILGA